MAFFLYLLPKTYCRVQFKNPKTICIQITDYSHQFAKIHLLYTNFHTLQIRKTKYLQASGALLSIRATITMKSTATLRTTPRSSFPRNKISHFKTTKKKTKKRSTPDRDSIIRYLAMQHNKSVICRFKTAMIK